VEALAEELEDRVQTKASLLVLQKALLMSVARWEWLMATK
jgi:hypothetical protein